jgi:hypothetical protein
MGPLSLPIVNLNKKFLSNQADATLELSSPDGPALLAALKDPNAVMPPGEIVIGNAKATAGGSGTVQFGGGQTAGSVTFKGDADASFSVGVYADAADAIKAIAPATQLSDGLNLADTTPTRYMVVRAAYDISASAKGSIALGVGASATFGVSGSSDGLFAVLHRFRDTDHAVQVFQDTFGSWALPRQVEQAADLAPGTWLIAQVDGSFAMQLGVQAGYDYSWIRQIPGGALAGPIGLRVQLGASAALGFEASGSYAVVLGREADDQVLRLRLYKMAKKGWNFALDARVGVQGQLPPFFDQPHTAEDLVAAIFGWNNNQIVDLLHETRDFVNSNVSLQDKLAGVLMDLGGKAIEETTGLTQDQIKAIYEDGRAKVMDFLNRFDNLLKNGGHDLTSMLLSLSGADLAPLQNILQQIQAGGEPQVQSLVTGLLSEAGFERTPIARFIEAAVGPALGVINNTGVATQLKSLAGDALKVLNGDTLQKLFDFIGNKINFDKILAVANQTDFDHLDNLLKDRIAAFLGKQKALIGDLTAVQNAIRSVLAHVDKFVDMAIAAAKKNYEFSFSYRYAQSTTRTALIDVAFDLQQNGALALMKNAVNGDLNDLLLKPLRGITLNSAELTHNIQRTVSSDLTMPFGSISNSANIMSSAKLDVIEDHGRVLVYDLDASSTVSQRNSLFGARSGRDSTLTVAGTMPLSVNKDLKVWKDSTFKYSYQMQRAVAKMRVSQMLEEIGPLVDKYVPMAFSGPETRSFPEFVADLDKSLDGKDPDSGTHDIGDTLVTLSLTTPPPYLRAWTKASADRNDPKYMELSRALQARLKELVMFYYFSDPSRYKDLASSAAPILFSCFPVSTSIKLNQEGGVDKFNTNTSLHWYQSGMAEINAMAFAPQTQKAVAARMTSIARTLRGIPELAGVAKAYASDDISVRDLTQDGIARLSITVPTPQWLGGLLDMEKSLIENAVSTGVQMAAFEKAAGALPQDALARLAQFGEKLVGTFNQVFDGRNFMGGASEPLATLLFLEASSVFDPSLTGSGLAALLTITVIQSGKLSIDDMLSGKIAPSMILHEQPFVQA